MSGRPRRRAAQDGAGRAQSGTGRGKAARGARPSHGRGRRGRSWLWILLAATPLLLAVAWVTGFLWFVDQIPRTVVDRQSETDAIVVLTGGAERLAAGVDLLEQGYAKALFVSGVHRGLGPADVVRLSGRPSDKAACCISVGYAAADTFGNALETARWMRERHYRSMRLVTGDFHMPRARMLMARALPEAKVIPNPVFPEGVRRDGWPLSAGVTRLLISEYHKYVLAWAITGLAGLLPGGDGAS